MRLRDFCSLSYFFSYVCLAAGLLMQSEIVLAAATAAAGLAYAGRDYFSRRVEATTILTVYAAFASLWFGVANLVGYLAENGPHHERFYNFDVREYQYTAQLIGSCAVFIPLVVYDWLKARRATGWKGWQLPRLGFEVSDRTLFRIALGLLAVGWGVRYLNLPIVWLGTLSSLVIAAPNVAILTLKLRWLSPPRPQLPAWTRHLPFLVMAAEVAQFSLFSNMRNDILWPIIAFSLPYVLLKRLTFRRLAFGVMLFLTFASLFRVLGEIRGKVFGAERLSLFWSESPWRSSAQDDEEDDWGLITLAARLSTFNQLTQVMRLVDEGGYYHGETLKYLAYVFVPRALWRNKPTIAPGQWFAEKIGRGQRLTDNRFSNAVNMTVPGELFLNFGWTGTAAGLALMSLLYFLVWEATAFLASPRNPIANLMAFGLFQQAMFTGAHFGGVVNMVLLYLAGLACAAALSRLVQAMPRRRPPQMWSPPPVGPLRPVR